MPGSNEQAQRAIEKLLQSEEGQLYEQLGLRSRAIAEDVAKAGSFEPSITDDTLDTMGLRDEAQELGRRLFNRWQVEIYNLVCGSAADNQKERKAVLDAIGLGEVAMAASLTGVLISLLGLAPPIAAVVAALVVKRFFRPAHEEICRTWSKHLPAPGG